MQGVIGMLAQSFGISPNVANMALNLATKMLLQKSNPSTASGLLSGGLPSFLTDMFSNDEKKEFTTSQQSDLSNNDVLNKLSEITGIHDQDKLSQLGNQLFDILKRENQQQSNNNSYNADLMDALKDLYKGKFQQF